MRRFTENDHDGLAGFFEEIARMLRKHPEVFDQRAIDQIGVVAGLSTRVMRLAGRGRTTMEIVREVSGPLVADLFRISSGDRAVVELIAGARRGFVRAASAITSRDALHRAIKAAVADAPNHADPRVVSACPRCGHFEARSLTAPTPCSECGFTFEAIAEA